MTTKTWSDLQTKYQMVEVMGNSIIYRGREQMTGKKEIRDSP